MSKLQNDEATKVRKANSRSEKLPENNSMQSYLEPKNNFDSNKSEVDSGKDQQLSSIEAAELSFKAFPPQIRLSMSSRENGFQTSSKKQSEGSNNERKINQITKTLLESKPENKVSKMPFRNRTKRKGSKLEKKPPKSGVKQIKNKKARVQPLSYSATTSSSRDEDSSNLSISTKEATEAKSRRTDFVNFAHYDQDWSSSPKQETSDPFKSRSCELPNSAVVVNVSKENSCERKRPKLWLSNRKSQHAHRSVRPMAPEETKVASSKALSSPVKKSPKKIKLEQMGKPTETLKNKIAETQPTTKDASRSINQVRRQYPSKQFGQPATKESKEADKTSFWTLVRERRLKKARPEFHACTVYITIIYLIGCAVIISTTVFFANFYK